MKRILLLLFFLTTALGLAQVGVNTTTPDPSSMLDVSATNKGVLVPRVSLANVTTTTLDGTNTAATGLLIWNTNATTVGGNGVGFYFFNGTQWMPITQTSTTDHDIYEVGSTNPPNAINDNKYTEGSLTIGTNTAATGVLDVDNATKTTSVDINNTFATNPTGIDVNLTSNAAGKTGIKTQFNGTAATGNNSFIQNTDNMVGNTNRTAINNDFSGTSSSISTSITGLKNDFKSTSNYYAILYGVSNSFASTTNAWGYGMVNAFSNGGTTPSFGVVNSFNGTSTGSATGLSNSSSSYNGSVTGVDNSFTGTGNGIHYGVNNFLNGTGTGDKYGLYNFIATTAGGNHYGLYSNVLKPGSFAGYFQGAVSIGTTTTNTYILPPSRGTNGQIMQTDAAGNVSWVTPASTTDHDWYEVGGTNPANAITDNIYTSGDVSIGKNTAAVSKMDIEAQSKTSTLNLRNNNTTTGSKSGINNNLFLDTTNAFSSGILNNVSGNVNYKYGVNNILTGNITLAGPVYDFGVKSTFNSSGNVNSIGVFNDFYPLASHNQLYTGILNDVGGLNHIGPFTGVQNNANYATDGTITGLDNSIGGAGIGNRIGLQNSINGGNSGTTYGVKTYITGNGSGLKYGESITIPSTTGGQHFGLYSDVLKSGSYAGYFLGNVSIGTTTTNNYILPPSRGTNGQTMQTDGSGNVTWVNSPTDTDDQGTDVFSLTGNTLNLSLQNDGVATQTVDLSSLKDADWFEVGGTNSPDAITDNKFTLGDISIGKITAASGKLDVDAGLKNVTTSFLNNNTTTGSKWGIQNNVIVDTNNAFSYGISNAIGGNADFKYGIYNTISGAITGGSAEYGLVNNHMSSGFFTGFGVFNFFNPSASHTGNYIGLHNEISGSNHTGGFIGVNNLVGQNTNSAVYGVTNSLGGTGSGVRAGVYNFFSGTSSGDVVGTETYMIATGTGNKYGERITIPNTLPGIHYGVYSDVTKTNSFAGYFLGKVSVGTNIIDNYILPPSRGLNGQIMQTDGAGNVSWADAPSDADWYEVGGLTPANSILDNIFTGGDVSIGKATAATGKVDIEADNKTMTLVLENNNATSGSKSGIDNSLTANANNALSRGILNRISGLSSLKFGVTNSFTNNNPGTSITEVGYNNDYTSTGNVNFVGHSNSIFPFSTNSGTITGYVNNVTGSVTGEFTGFVNSNFVTTNSLKTGLMNAFSGGGNGDSLGINNSFTGITNGEIIGVNTNINSSGTGLKYGEKITIDNTSGGIHCGIYADVTKANSYAGYFLGRVSIGNTLANNYILPASRGTNGQIMQTDGVGNVSWVNPTTFTDTDNQQIDVLSLTGDTLNISLQDDAVATQTLNLAAIDNQGTDVFSLTGNTLNLSLQNDGVATQTVDLSPLSNDWKLTGNAGTLSGTNFLGTTDAQDLDFRVNNVVKIRLTQQGQLSFVNAGGSVFVGINAGDVDDLTNNQNTFVGSTSGQFTTTGNLNTGIGHASLNGNISGVGNSGLGKSSLLTNTTGSNNTGVGRLADVATSGLSNATAVGYNATVSVSDKVRLGSTTVTVVEGQVPYTNPSDARFKFNVQENVPGLDFIKKLKPVTYNFDTKKFDEHLNKNRNREEVANEDFSESTAIIRTGFLAQDVEKICTDLGYNFDGLHVPDASNPTDNYGIAYSQFIMPIVKAVQEQQVIIETQKTELEQLKSELEKYKMLEERIKALEQK